MYTHLQRIVYISSPPLYMYVSVVLARALSVYTGVCLQVTIPGSPLAFFTTIVPHAANLYTMIARICHLCYFDEDGDGGRVRDMGGGEEMAERLIWWKGGDIKVL